MFLVQWLCHTCNSLIFYDVEKTKYDFFILLQLTLGTVYRHDAPS